MKNLKILRKKDKLTLKELAEKFDISFQAISLYENGKRQPDFDTLIKLADYFGVSVDYLIGRTGASSAPFGTSASPLTEEENELLQYWRLMDNVERRAVLDTAKAFAGKHSGAAKIS